MTEPQPTYMPRARERRLIEERDELIKERDELVRWRREDEAALAEMRATIERLRSERDELIRQRDQTAMNTTKATAPDPAARTEALRDRIAEAARTVPLRLGPHAIGMAERGELIRLSVGEAWDVADAVLAVLPEPVAELRLRLAHQARRAKEHQLDGIRRALCDVGLMRDDDPYSHADLADVIRQAAPTGPGCLTAWATSTGHDPGCDGACKTSPKAASKAAAPEPAFAAGMPCQHGCRAAAGELTHQPDKEAQQ